MYNTIETGTKLTTTDFLQICEVMFGGTDDQRGIAASIGVSRTTVYNMLKGIAPSKKSSAKVIEAWNAFVETGSAPKPAGLIDESGDDGQRPFVKVDLVRDRDSGRMYKTADVQAGLIGVTEGPIQSDEEVVARIAKRFNVLTNIVRRMLRQKVRSAVIQAAPGVGKTHTIEGELSAWAAEDETRYYKVLSGGGVSAFALYRALYLARNGGVVILDDNDSFLDADESLNMLKNALDSSEKRVLTWSKRNSMVKDVELHGDVEEDDERIPNSFEFNGSMIFITNLDFESIAESGSARANHVAALMDRSYFLNLTIKTLRDKVLWCTHVFENFMAPKMGLDEVEVADIVKFVRDNQHNFFIMSLRLFLCIGELAADPEGGDWKEIIEATKFRGNARAAA